MLNVETARHQVTIAGRVTNAVTGRPIAGAQVQIGEAPDAFVARLVLRAKNVRFDWPALDVVRPLPIDPAATPEEVLQQAKAILANVRARVEARVNAARVIMDHPGAETADRLAAAQIILDTIQTRQTAPLRRPDQTLTTGDGAFFFMDAKEGPYKLVASLPGSGSRYNFDGRLFELDVVLVADLDAGNKTPQLEAAFRDHNKTLPPEAKLSVKQAGSEWVVSTDVAGTAINLYRIRKAEQTLSVYGEKIVVLRDEIASADMLLQPTGIKGRVLEKQLFSVDAVSTNELDNEQLPDTIRKGLEKYIKHDPQDPTEFKVIVVTLQRQWKIKAGSQEYLVVKQDNTLNVYEQDDNQALLAEVRVVGSGEYTFSNSSEKGKFSLVGLEQGERTVRVSAQGYQPVIEPVHLEKGVMTLMDIRLERQNGL